MYKEYEMTRINFNNWQELYFKGNWGMSQNSIDFYGRDFVEMDYWFIFRKRKRRLK